MLRPVDSTGSEPDTTFLPRRIYWEVTRGCNLRCLHCRATPTELASPEDLSTDRCKAIMDRIAVVGHPVLVLTGGEPLFRSDIYELGAYGRAHGFRMGLATNGTLVTPEVAHRIVEAGFQKVGISLDGADAATHDRFRQVPGAFEAAVAGIRALRAVGVPVQVNTSITTHNSWQLDEMLAMVQGLGAASWHLFLLVPVGCGIRIAESMQVEAEEYERVLNWLYEQSTRVAVEPNVGTPMDLRAVCAPHYFRIRVQRRMVEAKVGGPRGPAPAEAIGAAAPNPANPADSNDGFTRSLAHRRGCLAGTSICFISHRGEVFPCGYLPVQAGDLREETFAEIWENSPVFLSLRDPARLGGRCGRCEFRILCAGCRARAYGMSGDYLAEEPFCLYQPGGLDPARLGEPEVTGEPPDSFTLSWSGPARAALERIPFALRPQVIREVETYAIEHGVDIITPEMMRRAREQAI